MKVVGLDISTSTGWSFFLEKKLVECGSLKLPLTLQEYGEYPWNYWKASNDMSDGIIKVIDDHSPDIIVIEEINLGKSRYAQRILEWIHKSTLDKLQNKYPTTKVIYVSSSKWRQSLGLQMSKEDRRNNAKLSKAKRLIRQSGSMLKVDKANLGIRGKITKKHLAIRYVNSKYSLQLKMKDNDKADAVCIADAYFCGAQPCDGIT